MELRSANVTQGVERAPNRSLFYAMGYTKEELDRPLIGVVSAYSEIVPGHAHLDKIAQAVKDGIRMAGGTPVLVPAIGVCDGIAMGHVGMKYSLASRELIADSVETMAMAHQFDGLVLVPNCDKIVPGMVMAAVRMNVPTVVCSGGTFVSLEDRVAFCENEGPEIFVSIHVNSAVSNDPNGIETHWYHDYSKDLAEIIHKNMTKEVKANDRGLFKSKFYVINHTTMPAVLCEIGFLSNDAERNELVTEARKQKTAKAIAEGIMEYLKGRK